MRRVAGLCMAVAALALAAGCGKTSSTTANNSGGGGGGGTSGTTTRSIAGTYLIVGIEKGGDPVPAELLANTPESERIIKFTADKMILTKGGEEDRMSYKVDTARKPYQIEMTPDKGGKGQTSYGIYKVEGDKLVICAAESDNPADRPTEFKTTKGGEAMMMTLKKK